MLSSYDVDDLAIVRDAGYDRRGEPNTPTVESVNGYITWKTHLVRDIKGEEVVSSGFVEFVYDGTIDHKDKIRINSVDYPIIALEPLKDFDNVGLRIHFR